MPGIVPLGNQAASSLPYTPALGSAGMRSHGPSYQVLLAAIAAGARPHTCPTVAVCVEKFLQLSARLAGCGGSPPKVTAEKQVMSLVLCTSFDSYLVCRICSPCPPVGGWAELVLLPVLQLASSRHPDCSSRYYYECYGVLWGLYLTTCLAGQDHPSSPQSGEEARWGLVCLCRRRQLLGLPSLSQEAEGHGRDQLGGGEGTESVEQYLATFSFTQLAFLD